MARGSMHSTCARIQGDMLAKNDRHMTLIEGVMQLQPLESRAVRIGEHVTFFDIPAIHGLFEQALCNQQTLFAMITLALHHGILDPRIQRYRLVGGKCPRSGRPDHNRERPFTMMIRHRVTGCKQRLLIDDAEAHIDRIGLFVLILYFGFSQG